MNANINRQPGAPAVVEGRKCRIYDVAKKQLIRECESLGEAAKLLGFNHRAMVAKLIKTKGRSHKNKLGITVAIR